MNQVVIQAMNRLALQVRCGVCTPYACPPSVEHVKSKYASQARLAKHIPVRAPPLAFLDYKDIVSLIENKQVKEVEINKDENTVSVKTNADETIQVEIPEGKGLDFMNKLTKHDVDVTVKRNDWALITSYVLQYVIILAMISMIVLAFSQRKTMSDMTKGPSGLMEDYETNVKFDDVAGVKNAKQDLQEIVEFLKNPDKFKKVGAKVPKGALLIGPSGTGKTLLAKAVAGESGVPFFSCSASEMIQMFVGMGAARIRSLFEKASAKSPSIIFIDEIDAVGRTRSVASTPGNDERDQTINQLLTEMDGFKERNVIVIAATNRVDVLDPALLRPGRFDRQVPVELPDYKDRVGILKVHTRDKPLENVNLEVVAKMTTGFSGADLANLANEAAIFAARNDQEVVTMANFTHALDKITLGDRRDILMSEEKRRIVAYHEAGHALVALEIGLYENVRAVSIIPRGKTGGVTVFELKEDQLDSSLLSKQQLEDQIAVALGGRIAEELVFGERNITTGASGDLGVVYSIARHMVTHYGMSKKVGAIAWPTGSESIQSQVDEEVKRIVSSIYEKTRRIVRENMNVLESIAEKLLQQEVLSGDEVKELMISCKKM